MDEQQKEFAIRNFRLMVGTEFSGQEQTKEFIECAFLWYNKKHEIFPKLQDCSCGENDLNLRDVKMDESLIVFVYKCDYCPTMQGFSYNRGVK